MDTPTSVTRIAVVGAGVNGLVCANRLQRNKDIAVTLFEASSFPGGSARSIEVPFSDGVCRSVDGGAAVYPLGAISPAFHALLPALAWCRPAGSYAQILDSGEAVVAWRSIDDTCRDLGSEGDEWRRFIERVPEEWPLEVLSGGLRLRSIPTHIRAGLNAKWSRLGTRGQALFAGVAAHTGNSYGSMASVISGYVLAKLAHGEYGWPLPSGGSSVVINQLVRCFIANGGDYRPGATINERPSRFAEVMYDTRRDAATRLIKRGKAGSEPTVVRPAKDQLALRDAFRRHSTTVQRIDLYYDVTPKWRDERLSRVGTVHFGGDAASVKRAMAASKRGQSPDLPYGMFVVPGQHDTSRDPGMVWAYVHVPWSARSYVSTLVDLIEQLAPGSARHLKAHRMRQGSALKDLSLNLADGDLGAGNITLRRLARGLLRPRHAYRIDGSNWLCSAETPPGPGAHGWCGWNAADAMEAALRH